MSTSIVVNNLSFRWPDGAEVFDGLEFVASDGRTGFIGDNGTGKSTLLRLVAGVLRPSGGTVDVVGELEWLPQELPLTLHTTVDELLGIADVRRALRAIEAGDADERHFTVVGDAWDVEEIARAELDRLGLDHVDLDRPVAGLSGGESMLVGLAGKLLRKPDILVLDEPTNNLDIVARERLYQAVEAFGGTLLVVSHDRALLERMDAIAELRDGDIRTFEGPYSAYEAAVEIEQEAARRMVRVAKADMKRQKQELIDTQVKLARRERYGRKMFENTREPKIVMNARKRQAQVSAAKLKGDKQTDLSDARQRLDEAEEAVRDDAAIRVDLPETEVPAGRDVCVVRGANLAPGGGDGPDLFGPAGVDLHLRGPERIGLLGANGSGKTTLLRLLAGDLGPRSGTVKVSVAAHYLPQRLELLDDDLSVIDNMRRFAPSASNTLLRTRLARFLFRTSRADQRVATLSGGERLRAALACVLSAEPAPGLLMLDEPTNNLDMSSVRQLQQALNAYRGALILVSHDVDFLRAVGVNRWYRLSRGEAPAEVTDPADPFPAETTA
ncbi:ATPase subunit of ABC transporter with duplicated ATPase domains [Stackebrandtia albiflava]|uniref:ATPase subunit of ABC transporter with duplicated ATPase domains n=1 Tax=Stackebrandtia albiflava TaxID=406432 RepID=A0A562UYA2_9ACTN|nr:ABC-F family ATP-binding cassette domain-containing protein [Stackebrandtia albiflava]TWJ10573.1 ATPase subunit of ABC transporter with duplicated ATPase domains [Stackebrandtia albiflava]